MIQIVIFVIFTFAIQPTYASTKLAFGSCLHQGESMPILSAIKKERPELFVMLGDNVYGSFEAEHRWPMARAYRRQFLNMKALKFEVPTIGIWDDGDYGTNDGGSDFAHQEQSKSLFLDFWKLSQSKKIRKRAGVYFEQRVTTSLGEVQILMLDVRSFKSAWKKDPSGEMTRRYQPDWSEGKTILGGQQWDWLEQRLREPAVFRILVSPLQVLAAGHFWECWQMFPLERQRLVKLIESLGLRNLLIISGDRHRATYYKLKTRSGLNILEMTTSALNRPAVDRDEPGPLRLHKLYVKENYGLVEVLGERRQVRIQLKDVNGKTLYGHHLFDL